MSEEPPDSKEVSNFHFNQLRTLRIAKETEKVPHESINVIAPASKYGLLFIGVSVGFKVLKLENILDLDEAKENKNIEENYYSQVIGCEPPILMALSADQKTLAVCVKRNSNVVADMYDIAAFADPDEKPEPFLNVSLSSNGSRLKDFLWNPVIDTMYAFCMSDGSLGVHELTGMKLTITATLPTANATAACWSPKGKQIVVGKRDGSLSQYKPTLQEAKSIPAPNDYKYSVANICWVSTAQFAVLYVPEGQNVSPCLFIVSTPKNAPIVYINFGDLCLGNASSSDQRYFLHHESAWGVLVCASTDSIEVAVLGDSPSWVQWEIRDDLRALLPSKHGAKNAVSMGVMYCSQRQIVISETESYPPMPIIFYLTDNGLLVAYHLVNTAPGSANLVRPSTPIERENERKQIGNKNQKLPASLGSSLYVPQPSSASAPPVASLQAFQSPQFQQPSTPTIHSGSSPSIGLGQKGTPQMGFGAVPFQTPTPKASPAPIGLFQTPQTPVSPIESERFHKASKGQPAVMPTTPVSKDPSGIRQVAVAQRLISGGKADIDKDQHSGTVDLSLKQVPTPSTLAGAVESTPKLKEDAAQMAYLSAIFEEIQTFEKELFDLKKPSDYMNDIGTDKEKENLMSSAIKFQEFQKEMSDTMSSLNQDIHDLKNVLLESFCIVEEANSKEKRKNDHVYISMLKERALDPISAKRMDSIKQMSMYLGTQLQEVQNKLDLDWFEFLERKKKKQRATHHILSSDAIYKTVAKNRQTIHFLEKTVENLEKKVDEKKRENIYKRNMYRNKSQFKRADNEDLSKLADAFLQTKITSYEEIPHQPKKMSSNAQDFLKKLLSSSTIKSVRPTIINSPSQSRLLSKCLSYTEKPSEETPIHSEVEDKNSNIHPSPLMKPSVKMQYPVMANENITPISKPKVTSITEFEKLRLQNRLPNDNMLMDQYKASATIAAPNLLESELSFSPLKHKQSGQSEEDIESPIYEDITPPDSPDVSRYSQGIPDSKVLQVSFKQGVPDVQQGGSSNIFEVKDFTSDKIEKLSFAQDTKPPSLFFTSLKTAAPNVKPFSSSSTLTSKHSFNSPSSDATSKFNLNQAPLKDKPQESAFSLQPKPVTDKPASAESPFSSFFAPTSSSSFPSFSTGSSFFSKKEDSIFKPSPLASEPAASLKTTSEGSEDTSAPPSSASSVWDLGSDTAKTSSLFASQKPLGSDAKFESFKFTQPSTTTAAAGGKEATSFFGKPPNATKELGFFTSAPFTSTSSLSKFSFSSTTKENTPLTSELKFPQPPSAESSQKTLVAVIKESPDSPTPSQPSLSSSDPVNLSQSAVTSSLETIKSSVLSPNSSAPAPLNLDAASTPVSATQVESLAKPVDFSFSQTQLSSPASVATSASQDSSVGTTPSIFGQPAVTSQPTSSTIGSSSFFGGGIVATTAPATSSVVSQPIAQTLFSTATTSAPSPVVSQPVSQVSLFPTPATTDATTAPVLSQAAPASTTSSFFDQSGKSSFFNKPADAPAFGLTPSLFGTSTAATTTSSFFSQPTSVFGGAPAATTTGTSVFGGTPSSTTTGTLVFGTPTTTTDTGGTPSTTSGSSVFGGALATTTGSSVFGGTTATTGSSVFGGTPTTSGSSVFGVTPSTTTGSSVFGGTSAPNTGNTVFGGTPSTTTGTSVFGGNAVATGGNSVFGGTPTNTTGNSVFGGTPANTSGNSVFGGQTAIKSPFGQTQGSFGLAKSVFGQQNSNTAAPVFGQPASPASNSSPFGQTSNSGFGQGSFFSGLGGKPSAENASKNVFSVGNLSAQPSEGNAFGATSFGGVKTGGAFTGGSFSSGGQSVAQSGFGAFQTTPQKTGGFGTAPAFGGAPAFGSPPAFGSAPTFGGSSLGAVFGSSQPTQNANFSNFASASSPTFGSLATQGSGGFGNASQQPAFGQSSPFGGAPAFGGNPSFGGQPSSGFGSPSSTSGASAFTQWRN